ncbi:hypothetical protein ARMGADRAFT_1038548 [Armillaria gallica]|uniref:Uncharacterized protein n=1 Tax=Armillaria gallica TaxID=47427 RepID=A0A2H3CHE0_ARMGA|nr:hypothetical protein ARMGADRAFT_1038548 [Armillaria gallica]
MAVGIQLTYWTVKDTEHLDRHIAMGYLSQNPVKKYSSANGESFDLGSYGNGVGVGAGIVTGLLLTLRSKLSKGYFIHMRPHVMGDGVFLSDFPFTSGVGPTGYSTRCTADGTAERDVRGSHGNKVETMALLQDVHNEMMDCSHWGKGDLTASQDIDRAAGASSSSGVRRRIRVLIFSIPEKNWERGEHVQTRRLLCTKMSGKLDGLMPSVIEVGASVPYATFAHAVKGSSEGADALLGLG